MNGIMSFLAITIGISLFITLISIVIFKSKKILLPIIILLFSLALLSYSFFVGNWEGMGLGMISLSLFIASPISLILITLLDVIMNNKKRMES